jgi:hypothetical protein
VPSLHELIDQGITAYTRGLNGEAERCWREALALDPGNQRARAYLEQFRAVHGQARAAGTGSPPSPPGPAAKAQAQTAFAKAPSAGRAPVAASAGGPGLPLEPKIDSAAAPSKRPAPAAGSFSPPAPRQAAPEGNKLPDRGRQNGRGYREQPSAATAQVPALEPPVARPPPNARLKLDPNTFYERAHSLLSPTSAPAASAGTPSGRAAPAPWSFSLRAAGDAALRRVLRLLRRLDRKRLRVLMVAAAAGACAAAIWAFPYRLVADRGREVIAAGRQSVLGAVRNARDFSAGPARRDLQQPEVASPSADPDRAGLPAEKPRKERAAAPAHRVARSPAATSAPTSVRPRGGARDIAVAGLSFPPDPGRPEGMAWEGVRWGMTIDEILRAYRGKAARLEVAERVGAGGLIRAAAIRQVKVRNHFYGASFLFDKSGRLGAIQLKPTDLRDGCPPAYDDLAATLSAEHGPPLDSLQDSRPSGSWVRRAYWKTPESLIELNGWETAPKETHLLTVDLDRGDIRPLNGGVVLTYRPAAPDLAPPSGG